jgi:hypothetical protein
MSYAMQPAFASRFKIKVFADDHSFPLGCLPFAAKIARKRMVYLLVGRYVLFYE